MTDAPEFRGLADQSGGLLAFFVIRQDKLPRLVSATLNGDARSAQLVRAALSVIDGVESAPRHDLVPCGCCLQPVRHRSSYRIGIALPDVEVPHRAMAFALCQKCCATTAAEDEAAIKAVRDVFPSSKAVSVTHQTGGRA
jgi:hypothetical protein